MEFKDLIKELNTHIDSRVKEIASLGQESRELDKKIDALYAKMSKIYLSLQDVHPIILERYPEQVEFLESLANYKPRFEEK